MMDVLTETVDVCYNTWNVMKGLINFDFASLLKSSMLSDFGDEDFMLNLSTDEEIDVLPNHSSFNENVVKLNDKEKRRLLSCSQNRNSQVGSHLRRKKRRESSKTNQAYVSTVKSVDQFVKNSIAIPANFDFSAMSSNIGAYSSKNTKPQMAQQVFTKKELVETYDFTVINWNGRDSQVVVDAEQRVFMALVGQPEDPTYHQACKDAFDLMTKISQEANFQSKSHSHRRGQYPVLNAGVSHAMGSVEPFNINNHEHNVLIERLTTSHCFRRLAGFANASFAAFSPNVYAYYKNHLNLLFNTLSYLKHLFPPHISIYPAAAFNFGPNVWTYKHKDSLNCPFGWCAIQALGQFDPTKGGQLVLWEPKLVINFPAGSLILLPSGTITHSNIPVAPGDTRASFTQYAAGGLFRYIDYGFRTQKKIAKEDPNLWALILRKREKNWAKGYSLLSTLDELHV